MHDVKRYSIVDYAATTKPKPQSCGPLNPSGALLFNVQLHKSAPILNEATATRQSRNKGDGHDRPSALINDVPISLQIAEAFEVLYVDPKSRESRQKIWGFSRRIS